MKKINTSVIRSIIVLFLLSPCVNIEGMAQKNSHSPLWLASAQSAVYVGPQQQISFNASFDLEGVSLAWEVPAEPKGCYYIIERSVDGINFETIYRKDGLGKKQDSSYVVVDENPPTIYSFYRVKQVMKNGTINYTEVQMIYSGPDDYNSFPDDETIA